MLSPSLWPGWVRAALLLAACVVAFVPYVGLLVALALVAASIVSFRAAAAVRRDDAVIREELMSVPVTASAPVATVELDVPRPFEVAATAYHRDAIAVVVDTRSALAAESDPLFAALELEPNNPFDTNAVRVDLLLFSDAHPCGYVPPALTREWADRIRPLVLDARTVIVPAAITGDGSTSNPFRVRLG